MKNLIGYVEVPIDQDESGARPEVVGRRFENLPALLAGQYYLVNTMSVLIDYIRLGTYLYYKDNAIARVDPIVHVTSDAVATRALAAQDLGVSAMPQSMSVINFSIAQAGASGQFITVSDTNNMHEAYGVFGATALDSVASGSGLNAIARTGNILSGMFRVWIDYDIVTLTDPERIEILQRCECPAVTV